MNPVLRNILAVLAGLIAGNAVNFGIVMLGVKVVPRPKGLTS